MKFKICAAIFLVLTIVVGGCLGEKEPIIFSTPYFSDKIFHLATDRE